MQQRGAPKQHSMASKRKSVPLINREISWLAFNDRVLQEAYDPTVPLLERIRFMAIFSSNLDEFFRVRVASISRLVNLNIKHKELTGSHPKKLLSQIQKSVIKQQQKFDTLWKDVLIKELEHEKIFLINEQQLNVARGQFVRDYFNQKILSLLVPIMVDNRKTFPELRDKSIYLFVRLSKKGKLSNHRHALIEIPTEIHSRFIVLPETGALKYIILLDDVIRYCLEELFPTFDYDHFESYTIKITRDAELDIDNDVSKDFLEVMSKSIKQRKKGKPVRFVYDQQMPQDMLNFLIRHQELKSENLIPGGRYHNFKDFMAFPNVGSAELEYPHLPQLPAKDLALSCSLFTQIAEKDHLVFLPYQSFDYLIHLLREAAIDPKVSSIKITLYRVAQHSSVVHALINAARNGKRVTVFIELKARFDEENNIYYSEKLKEAGIAVLHSAPSLKVHSKMCLISRKEQGKLVHYANLSTGNYNEKTSKIYSDFSFFTADHKLTKEVSDLFESMTKKDLKKEYKHLLVAPYNLRQGFYKLIQREIQQAKKGKPAWIIAKVNSLVDDGIIQQLYKASQAGVKVKIIARGICCLVPGVPGVSENIEVCSIIDKYLEHARVFAFCNGGKESCYLGSADWMKRNLDHRIEVMFPIMDTSLKKEVIDLLNIQLADNVKARVINRTQSNKYRTGGMHNRRAQVDTYTYLQQLNSK